MNHQQLKEDEVELILAIRSHPPEDQPKLIQSLQDAAEQLLIAETASDNDQ